MIIGVAGRKGSGKDTVAGILVNNFNFNQIAFADNLKAMSIEVFGLTKHQCYDEAAKEALLEKPISFTGKHVGEIIDWVKKEKSIDIDVNQVLNNILSLIDRKHILFETPRYLLQFIGTEVLRDLVNKDYHAVVTYDKIKQNRWVDVAISDSRFENERNFVTKKMGYNVLVIGPKQPIVDGHRSENSLGFPEEYDWCIYNHKLQGLEQLNIDVTSMYRLVSGIKS